MLNPLQSTGWIVNRSEPGVARFLGTCFAFRQRNILLTAAHCIGGLEKGSLRVCSGKQSDCDRRLDDIIVHPDADVAILRLADGQSLPDVFGGETPLYDWGMPISAFGYPEDTGKSGVEPTPRYFRGNIQRLFDHNSHLGYSYKAAELSFGAPGGLSGGPVTPNTDYSMVMGLVAENVTSTTYLSTITEQIEEGRFRTEKIHAVITYAIVVRLDRLSPWLDEHVPFPGH